MMERRIKIYIADDHPIVVDGLKEILSSNPDFIVEQVCHDGLQLIELVKIAEPDVVILDINMPKMDGIKCSQWIKANHPSVKIIILTMYPEKTYSEQLLKAGVDGCMLKSRGTSDLLAAIDRVVSGKSYYDWITDFKKSPDVNSTRLSDREMEIVHHIIQGKSSNEIGNLLFISEETVKTHRKNIFKKLNIHHVTELTAYAIQNGI
jgi:DNA-binding NarL/FixJ family response regulator